ncbi:MAG: hypothetical protein ACUVTM_03615 [Candidatus Bathyarchaeia archaeon]
MKSMGSVSRIEDKNERKFVASVSVFAALHVILDVGIYPFRRWAIYIEPLEGIMLGPRMGLLTALVGASISRAIVGASLLSFVYGVTAESVGVVVAGLLAKGRWRIPLGLYGFMLTAYFLHPYGQRMPIWTMLDCIAGLLLVYPTSKMSGYVLGDKVDTGRLTLGVLLISFVATVGDSLTRVFLLVPAGLHKLEFETFEALYNIFIVGAAGSYIEDAIVSVVSVLVSVPILIFLQRSRIIRYPLT